MSDIGLYGICAAMIFGVLIVALVLRKWTKHNKFGISDFGLLLVGLVFLTIGVWGSLEITFGDLTLLTHRDFGPSTQAEVRHESGQPALPESAPTPRPGPGAETGPSKGPPPNPALPRGNPAQEAEQFVRLAFNPSSTIDDIIRRLHVPFCAERDIILSSVGDLRTYLESVNSDRDIGKYIVSVLGTEIINQIDFRYDWRWSSRNDEAKQMIARCLQNEIVSPSDHMVTVCVKMVDLKKDALIDVVVDRQSRLIKLFAVSANNCYH